MSITEFKDKLSKFGCSIRSHNGEINVIKEIPVEIASIDDDSVLYLNNGHVDRKRSLEIKKLCDRYYHERNGC